MSLDCVIAENNRLRVELAGVVSSLGYRFGAGLAKKGDSFTLRFHVYGAVPDEHKSYVEKHLPESVLLDIQVIYD